MFQISQGYVSLVEITKNSETVVCPMSENTSWLDKSYIEQNSKDAV